MLCQLPYPASFTRDDTLIMASDSMKRDSIPPKSKIRQRTRSTRIILISVVLLSLLLAPVIMLQNNAALLDPHLVTAKSILWVTAHRKPQLSFPSRATAKTKLTSFNTPPADDESFFFAPSIAALLHERNAGVTGYLLSLSIGA